MLSLFWLGIVDDVNFSSLSFIYFILLLLFLIDLINKPLGDFLKPSSIILLFTTFNFSLGNFAFHNNYFLKGHVSEFENIYYLENLAQANQYFIISLLFIYLFIFNKKTSIKFVSRLEIGSKILIIPYFTVLFFMIFFDFESNLFSILKVGLVLSLILNISKINSLNLRWILYLTAIFLYAITAFDDKRNILLAILCIAFVEINYKTLFKLKYIYNNQIGLHLIYNELEYFVFY